MSKSQQKIIHLIIAFKLTIRIPRSKQSLSTVVADVDGR